VKIRKILSYLVLTSLFTVLIGCVSNTPKISRTTQNYKNDTKPIVKQPVIEQDVYIKEAIRQIEFSKSKLFPERKKDFIAEYTYRASDTDSKVTSRSKASIELKKIILSEIGIHISSSLEITKQATIDTRVKTEINQVITSYTAGTVSMMIINEKWDGKNFYLKGKISIDPNSVAEGISEGLKAEAERKTILQLKNIVTTQTETLDLRSKKLINLQNELSRSLLLSKTKEGEVRSLRTELQLARNKLALYEAEELKAKNEINRIRNFITRTGNKTYNSLVTGMTLREVKSIAGEPRSTAKQSQNTYFNYGRVWVAFSNGITIGWIHNDDWEGAIHAHVYKQKRPFAIKQ
jgi:hypothetical protein